MSNVLILCTIVCYHYSVISMKCVSALSFSSNFFSPLAPSFTLSPAPPLFLSLTPMYFSSVLIYLYLITELSWRLLPRPPMFSCRTLSTTPCWKWTTHYVPWFVMVNISYLSYDNQIC